MLLCSQWLAWLLLSMGVFQNKAVHTSAYPLQQQEVVLRKNFNKRKLGRPPGYWKVQDPKGKKRQMGSEKIGPPFHDFMDHLNLY